MGNCLSDVSFVASLSDLPFLGFWVPEQATW